MIEQTSKAKIRIGRGKTFQNRLFTGGAANAGFSPGFLRDLHIEEIDYEVLIGSQCQFKETETYDLSTTSQEEIYRKCEKIGKNIAAFLREKGVKEYSIQSGGWEEEIYNPHTRTKERRYH
jgi:hypothetical protein